MITRLAIRLAIGLSAFLLPTAAATAAGFDCSKAKSADERAVCSNSRLSALDSEMTGLWYAYSRVPIAMGGSGDRQDEESAFLARRRQCGGNVACLTKVYNDRIAELRHDIAGYMTGLQPFITGGGGDSPDSSLPAAVSAALTDYATQCSKLGGSLVNPDGMQVLAGDVNGDGMFDYVTNPQPLECRGAATALCANNGCDIRLYLSYDQYAKPVSVRGGQPTLVQRDGRTDVEIWVSRSNCNAAVGTPCWAVYSWQGGKLNSRYRAGSGDSGS